MEPKLSIYFAGFRRNHKTQHALLRMIESWRALQNKGQKVGAIIMDLSKAFDTLNHKLLFKKLQAYGFDKKSLSFIESYFTNRKQRTKIGDSFSKYQRIITGVPQGSILGPLFFNIFINDLFLSIDKSTLCNYADDNTLYTSGNDANAVINKLKQDFSKIFKWFYENFMILNPDKCYFLTLGFQDAQPNFSYNNITIKNVSEEKILGITIDNKLTFKSHLKNICKKANQKLNALARITKFTSPFQRKTLLNSFIKSQFSYCPLIWMFTSKGLNQKINRIHEKSLRLVLNVHQSTLDKMLNTLNEKTIHQQCIDGLLTEVYNFLNGYSSDIMYKTHVH